MSFSREFAVASVARLGRGVTIARNNNGGILMVLAGKLTLEDARAQQSKASLRDYGKVASVEHTSPRKEPT